MSFELSGLWPFLHRMIRCLGSVVPSPANFIVLRVSSFRRCGTRKRKCLIAFTSQKKRLQTISRCLQWWIFIWAVFVPFVEKKRKWMKAEAVALTFWTKPHHGFFLKIMIFWSKSQFTLYIPAKATFVGLVLLLNG